MRYLGIDLGTKSLGLSITDRTNTLVRPLETLHFGFEKYDDVIPSLLEIINNNNVSHVILGLPKNMDGTIGFAGERSIKFKEKLEAYNINVILYDERLTTKLAENIVHMNEDNVKNTKGKIDSISACVILEDYIRGIQNGSNK